jgi:glutamate-1-semialdehyde 2,1-aminomutase
MASPDSAGVSAQVASDTIVVPLDDLAQLKHVFETRGHEIAAVIVEPVPANNGLLLQKPEFLSEMSKLAKKYGSLVIFDEVITGFRLALGGAQQRYGVTPDLSVLGKALGAGLPIGAVSGHREVMQVIASGRLLHRGTFNGNPVSIGAGIACLETLKAEQATLYPRIDRIGSAIAVHVNAEAKAHGAPIFAQNVGPCVQLFAGVTHMDGMAGLPKIDRSLILCLTSKLLQQGIYTLPRGLMYVSSVHTDDDLAFTKQAISTAIDHFMQGLHANR